MSSKREPRERFSFCFNVLNGELTGWLTFSVGRAALSPPHLMVSTHLQRRGEGTPPYGTVCSRNNAKPVKSAVSPPRQRRKRKPIPFLFVSHRWNHRRALPKGNGIQKGGNHGVHPFAPAGSGIVTFLCFRLYQRRIGAILIKVCLIYTIKGSIGT